MKIIKRSFFIALIGLGLAITAQSTAGQISITGKVTKVNNNTITIETIKAESIPEGSRVDLFFEISEGNSIEIGQWKVSGRGSGVVFATPVDVIGPPQEGMTAKISYSGKKKIPVTSSTTPLNKAYQDTSRENSTIEAIPEIRGKEPKGQLLGIPFPEKSANLGYPEAQFNLGAMYYNGMGVKKDDVTALAWFKKAADQNIPQAMYVVGQAHEFGRGTSKNMSKAKEYYKKAAKLGDQNAMKKLGMP